MPKWTDREFLSTPIAAPEPFDARERITFGEAYERSVEIAALLREQGVSVGTYVAVGGNNSAGWVESFLAVQLLGAVPVLLNNGLVGESQTHCLNLTKPKIVLADASLAAQVVKPNGQVVEPDFPVWCWGPIDHLDSDVRAKVTVRFGPQNRRH